ncbi:glutathione S-transferase omega-1-like [Dermacentor albipictus]|uniref:glutathione S-transferase omega-1-like n=1 Tax=Dermacentor albipictus TaxID=60249 RepID=UPI0031FD6E77
MDSWALASGSKFPPLVPGKLRLYSMRFCPYAQRALLILKAKSIDHEVVNINLADRPEWCKEVLPTGTVPVLSQDDKLISGSMPIIEYLEEAYPQTKPMLPIDPYLKALDRSFLDAALPAIEPLVSVLKRKGTTEENWASFLEKIPRFEKELVKRKTAFFCGLAPGFVDYAVWPTFELARGLSAAYAELEMPSSQGFPHFSSWYQKMREDAVVRAVVNEDHTVLFVQSCKSGHKDFDAGLH